MVKAAIIALLLAGGLWPLVGSAQSTDGACETCVAAAGCDTTHETCVAECRARLFNVDPRRADCIAACSTADVQCTRGAESACRAGNSCR